MIIYPLLGISQPGAFEKPNSKIGKNERGCSSFCDVESRSGHGLSPAWSGPTEV